MTGRDPDPT